MTKIMNDIRDFMGKEGIPGQDAYVLPTSAKSFSDSANYRIEIAGVEQILHTHRSNNEKM